MSDAKVLIMMGSDSDWEAMRACAESLTQFGVGFEVAVASAHRTPERVATLASGAEKRGIEVIVAGAGAAAALPGVVAAHTLLPVIGVPLVATELLGLDAMLAILQMPAGMPVATMAIGKAGAKNAGLFAVQLLARRDDALRSAFEKSRAAMREQVEAKDRALQQRLAEKGVKG